MDNIENQHKVSLRDYIEAKMNALEKQVDRKFNDLEKSIDTAYQANLQRLEGMNEFRAAIEDQAERMVSRAELEAYKDKVAAELHAFKELMRVELASMCDDIQKLELSGAELKGKASQNAVVVSYIVAGIAIVMNILSYIRAGVN